MATAVMSLYREYREARKTPGSKNRKNMILHYLKSVSLGAKAQKICWGREAKAQKTTGRFELRGAKPPELEMAQTMLIV